jgi:hypothetical protein
MNLVCSHGFASPSEQLDTQLGTYLNTSLASQNMRPQLAVLTTDFLSLKLVVCEGRVAEDKA